jgi:hypothetical protein
MKMKHLKSISSGIQSVAKLTIVLFLLACAVVAADTSPFASIAGNWNVRFGNGVNRVYRIAPDGSYTCLDVEGPSIGTVATENGRFIIHSTDGRIQRLTRVADSLLKVEAFADANAYAQGHVRTTGTGRLDTPAVPAMSKATPAATPTVTNPAVSVARALVLSSTWNTPMQGGTSTMDDLERLFGTLTTAKTELAGSNGILVYQNIPYLTPVRQAVAALKLDPRMMSKVLIACPGFPRDSFYYYSFDGRFEDGFNRLYLVVDRADQLVSVELVEEAPKTKAFNLVRDNGWHTYNFVLDRTKALNTLKIGHRVAISVQGKWTEPRNNAVFAPEITPQNANWTTARVDSVLAEPDPKNPARLFDLGGKEASRWYVPRPIVELILTCVQKGGR